MVGTFLVKGDDGVVLNALVDVTNHSVAIQSRGGSTGGRPVRNPDYEKALALICERAMKGRIRIQTVLIDSLPTRKLPESDRVLLTSAEMTGMKPSEVVSEIRAKLKAFGQAKGTKGGNSTKRVKIILDSDDLQNLLGLVPC